MRPLHIYYTESNTYFAYHLHVHTHIFCRSWSWQITCKSCCCTFLMFFFLQMQRNCITAVRGIKTMQNFKILYVILLCITLWTKRPIKSDEKKSTKINWFRWKIVKRKNGKTPNGSHACFSLIVKRSFLPFSQCLVSSFSKICICIWHALKWLTMQTSNKMKNCFFNWFGWMFVYT